MVDVCCPTPKFTHPICTKSDAASGVEERGGGSEYMDLFSTSNHAARCAYIPPTLPSPRAERHRFIVHPSNIFTARRHALPATMTLEETYLVRIKVAVPELFLIDRRRVLCGAFRHHRARHWAFLATTGIACSLDRSQSLLRPTCEPASERSLRAGGVRKGARWPSVYACSMPRSRVAERFCVSTACRQACEGV